MVAKERGCSLPLGEAVVEIDWVDPSDDDLARLLLALVGEDALAKVINTEAMHEDI